MDVTTTCFRFAAKFYRNAAGLQPVRWYRTVPGGPVIPFPHSFMGMAQPYIPELPPPGTGQVGFNLGARSYDKGKAPFWFRPNGHFVGAERQWRDGSDVGIDGNLTWTPFQFSKQCLAGLGFNPVAQRPRTQTLDGINDL